MRVRPRRVGIADERGATVVLVVICLVAMLGMTALAVDAGSLIVHRRRLVKIADSAALAAALSYGLDEAQCGTNDAPADAAATTVAQQNAQPYAAAPTLAIVRDCTNQIVKVTATAPATLGFAPVLGFSNTRDVHAIGRARWGGAHAFFGSALMLRADILKHCGLIPMPADTDPPPDIVCSFWINNGNPNDLGNSEWAMLNLFTQSAAAQYGTQWGWDVPFNYNCAQGVDAGWRARWLTQGVSWSLPLEAPGVTYVCPGSGNGQSVIQALKTQQYKIKQWPINCAWQNPTSSTLPYASENPSPECDGPDHGQVQSNGGSWSLCPPDSCTNPWAYDIIGFVPLQIWDFPRGDTPEAIGTPAVDVNGQCAKPNVGFTYTVGQPAPTMLLDTMTGNGCPGQPYPYITTISPFGTNPATPVPYLWTQTSGRNPVKTVYTPCTNSTTLLPAGCSYNYDAASHVITWMLPSNISNMHVEYNWNHHVDAQPGLCGSRAPDPNATCLVLKWAGPQQGGEDVGPGGGGYNFGTNGVSLCTIDDPVCDSL
jgi:hypothetical protein